MQYLRSVEKDSGLAGRPAVQGKRNVRNVRNVIAVFFFVLLFLIKKSAGSNGGIRITLVLKDFFELFYLRCYCPTISNEASICAAVSHTYGEFIEHVANKQVK